MYEIFYDIIYKPSDFKVSSQVINIFSVLHDAISVVFDICSAFTFNYFFNMSWSSLPSLYLFWTILFNLFIMFPFLSILSSLHFLFWIVYRLPTRYTRFTTFTCFQNIYLKIIMSEFWRTTSTTMNFIFPLYFLYTYTWRP